MDTSSGLRARLKRLLDGSGVGARVVARDANLQSQSHVGQVLRGDVAGPTPPTLEAIAHAFGVSPGWLTFGEGEAPTDDEIAEAGAAIRQRDLARRAAAVARAASDARAAASPKCPQWDTGGDLRFANVAALLAWTERRLADARAILTGLPADLAGQDLARVSRRCEALAADVGHLREAASWREGGEGDEEQQRDGEGNEVHAPNIGRVPARGEPGR